VDIGEGRQPALPYGNDPCNLVVLNKK
jgi:hypothetical protein